MAIKLGCGQITWSRGAPEDEVLEDIHKAGYEGAPWHFHSGRSRGGMSRSVEDLRAVLSRHSLKAAPAYLSGDLWDASKRRDLVSQAHHYAEVSAALGLSELYVCAGGSNSVMPSGRTRRQAAGHATPEDELPEEDFHGLVECLHAVGAATLEHGVRCCYHNHVGTVVETEDEIEKLLALADPDLVWLGPDTGHLAWGGIDVVSFCERYVERIRTIHLKDIDCDVRDRGRKAGWDYAAFSKNGIFTEVGNGCVDFASLLSLLSSYGFSGWLIVETDVTQLASPLESATVSRDNLRRLGL